jgi:hypothetical protein
VFSRWRLEVLERSAQGRELRVRDLLKGGLDALG